MPFMAMSSIATEMYGCWEINLTSLGTGRWVLAGFSTVVEFAFNAQQLGLVATRAGHVRAESIGPDDFISDFASMLRI